MKRTYTITGMTCEGCKASVAQALESLPGVNEAEVDLKKGIAVVNMNDPISIAEFQKVLDPKYGIEQAGNLFSPVEESSKLKQLQPLVLIMVYLIATTFLLHYESLNIETMIYDD